MTSSTDPGHRSPEEIEREIDEERGRFARTTDELQDRMSVGSAVDEMMYRTQAQGGDFARSFGRTLRENPLPLALVGVGLAWLMAGGQEAVGPRRRGRQYVRDWRYDEDASVYEDEWRPDEGSYGSMSAYGGPRGRNLRAARPGVSGISRGGVDWEETGEGPSVGERLGETAERARETAAGAAHRAGSAASDTADYAGDAAYGRARDYGRGATDTLDDMLEEQPLVVGALAMALGAAIGGLLPNTRAENRAMGERADRLRNEAAEAAAEEGAKARRVAEAAAHEAARTADEAAGEAGAQTPDGRRMVEEAEQRTREAAERVSNAAEEEARRQDLGRDVDPSRD